MSYRYDYTRTGRPKTRYINGKAALRYTYTKAGRIASITDICGKTTAYGYDLNGRLASVSEKGKVLAAYAYDHAGRVETISFANGMQTLYSYDTERNLASMETRDRNGSVLLSYSYQYDRNGNRTGKKDLKNGNATAYVYDTMQRLSEVTYPGTGKEDYRYDKAGNRIQKQTQSYVEDYLYDERNRLTQKSVKSNTAKSSTNPDLPEAENTNITTYQYDLQGSLIKEQSTDFCKQYLYNDFHQCIQTDVIRGREEEAERIVQENLYDGEGLRFAIIENGKRTGFITDGWYNVTELDGKGRVRKRIIRGLGIVASEDTEQKEDNIFTTAYHYYHGNERMDVEYITDEAGNVRNSYAYDAFGAITASTETIPNRYTYNGESYDKTTEQYYLRKRFYNPKLCRFMQEDEYRGDGLNLYAFCANNPVMYVDPSGYSFLDNLLFDSQDDIDSRVKQTPSEKATYGQWSDKRGDSRFYFNNTDHTPLHNRVEAIMAKHNATYVPYKNGQVDFDYFAVFTVDVVIDPKRSVTHPRTNEEIARIIVEYNGDYNRMYADNVMGIASGSQYSQNVAKEIIGSVSSMSKSSISFESKISMVTDQITKQQKKYNQTIHEENLVTGKTQNKTQWVDTDINKQFGHLGGTAEATKCAIS